MKKKKNNNKNYKNKYSYNRSFLAIKRNNVILIDRYINYCCHLIFSYKVFIFIFIYILIIYVLMLLYSKHIKI